MRIVKNRHTIQLYAAMILVIVGCGLLIAGFIVPPPGEIHNSVLVAFGESLTFAGTVFGMKYHYQYGRGNANKSNNTQEYENN